MSARPRKRLRHWLRRLQRSEKQRYEFPHQLGF